MLETISLDEAARILSAWWTQPVPRAVTPDWAVDAARKAGCTVRVAGAHEWEASSDEQGLLALTGGAGNLAGKLLLITEASFSPGAGAFLLDGRDLQVALAEHARRFEPVFNGDVLIAEVRTKRVFCLHHSGTIFVISAPPGTVLPPDREPPARGRS